MSFVKHALFVDEHAPALTEYEKIAEYILNRLSRKSILITSGIVDALDHSSDETLIGGKLGIDATGEAIEPSVLLLSDAELLNSIQHREPFVESLKQYMTHTANPITVIGFEKRVTAKEVFEKISDLKDHLRLVVFVDTLTNDINNPYMLIWRVVNNIDATRDIWLNPFIGIDATNKNYLDGFEREWPGDVYCERDILDSLIERNVIELDHTTIDMFQLCEPTI